MEFLCFAIPKPIRFSRHFLGQFETCCAKTELRLAESLRQNYATPKPAAVPKSSIVRDFDLAPTFKVWITNHRRKASKEFRKEARETNREIPRAQLFTNGSSGDRFQTKLNFESSSYKSRVPEKAGFAIVILESLESHFNSNLLQTWNSQIWNSISKLLKNLRNLRNDKTVKTIGVPGSVTFHPTSPKKTRRSWLKPS